MILLLNQGKKNVGCIVNRQFIGVTMYAYDLALLCPSVSGLQCMLNKCFELVKNQTSNLTLNQFPVDLVPTRIVLSVIHTGW